VFVDVTVVKKDSHRAPLMNIYEMQRYTLDIINVDNNVTTDRVRESVIQKQINMCY